MALNLGHKEGEANNLKAPVLGDRTFGILADCGASRTVIASSPFP